MKHDVRLVQPLEDYKIYVEIESGEKGIFDLKPYLEKGVFKELKNVDYFNTVEIIYGAVTWSNGQDIEPQTLIYGLQPLNRNENYRDINIIETQNFEKGKLEVAKSMKQEGFDINLIAKLTGLNKQQIENL